MKVKTLTYTGLEYLISKIINSGISENHYLVELEANKAYSFTVPNYEANKSIVQCYLNGLCLIKDKDYTLSAGKISLLYNMHTEGNSLHVVHYKRW